MLEGRGDKTSELLYDEYTNTLPGMRYLTKEVQDEKEMLLENFDSNIIDGQYLFCGFI